MKKFFVVFVILFCFAGLVMADTDTPTETQTPTKTYTVTETYTVTKTVTITQTPTQTITNTVTQTPTSTVTPTSTIFIQGNTVFQPVAKSGKSIVYTDSTRLWGAVRWNKITVDTLSNTGIPLYIYDGTTLIRKITVPEVPYVIDMESIPVQQLIIDYTTNTGTSTNSIKK